MGLYMKGLRLPKHGMYTKFTLYSDRKVVLHFGGTEVGYAEEVKEPHGRLVDADALIDYFLKWYDPDAEMTVFEFLEHIRDGKCVVPVVIKGETDGNTEKP